MSTFSFPHLMKPEAMIDAMPDMSEWMRGVSALPVPPLMVHPMAASVAATAVGIGMATQMMGIVVGSLEGALSLSQRLAQPVAESRSERPTPVRDVDHGEPALPARRPTAPRGRASMAPVHAKPAAGRGDGALAGLKAAASVGVDAVAKAEKAASSGLPRRKRDLAAADCRRPIELAQPDRPDDLKRISGIGPKLEQVLNGLGIWTFDQMAAWTAEEVAWLDDYLKFSGRIERDTWQEQASRLADAAK